jgi:hypothetical protein
MKLLFASACAAFVSACTVPVHAWSRGPDYALDDVDRSPPSKGQRPVCSTKDLVLHRGKFVRYDAPVNVHTAFAERLVRFEEIVRDVGVEVYGRAPKVLHHGGAFACRTTESGIRWSEHAFGNALDLEGFTFDATRDKTVDPKLRGVLRLHVSEAWRDGGSEHTKKFFALLLERLRARDDVFRAVIGPPDPVHKTHLHLDVGPWAYTRYAPLR